MNKSIIYTLLLIIFYSCNQDKGNKSYPTSETNNLLSDSLIEVESKKNQPSEFFLFKSMIDSVYPEILKRNFDTLIKNGVIENADLENHRIIRIILEKNPVQKNDLVNITGLYSCICKHKSIKKKDSQDLVIEEYVCKNADVASAWFNHIYNCYHDANNPVGEPLKEPYKIWQSDNRLIHIYTRAMMWSADLDTINKALMKNITFYSNKHE